MFFFFVFLWDAYCLIFLILFTKLVSFSLRNWFITNGFWWIQFQSLFRHIYGNSDNMHQRVAARWYPTFLSLEYSQPDNPLLGILRTSESAWGPGSAWPHVWTSPPQACCFFIWVERRYWNWRNNLWCAIGCHNDLKYIENHRKTHFFRWTIRGFADGSKKFVVLQLQDLGINSLSPAETDQPGVLPLALGVDSLAGKWLQAQLAGRLVDKEYICLCALDLLDFWLEKTMLERAFPVGSSMVFASFIAPKRLGTTPLFWCQVKVHP